MLLRDNACKVDPDAVIVQRLKRLRSIRKKLENTSLNLLQIQDLGGCRAVVSDADAVFQIVDRLEHSRTKHELYDDDDYIREPKSSGYRGYHLMFKHRSDAHPAYNGLRIEVQVRSALQHAWATAVETVGLFRQEDLKGGEGDGRWLEFFALMGSALALRENTAPIPGMPSDRHGVRVGLRKLTRELDVIERLRAHAITLKQIPQGDSPGTTAYLLETDIVGRTVNFVPFRRSAQAQAQAAYEHAEAQASIASGIDVVLVTADSVDQLRRAYPNYFADTGRFVEALREAIR
jgi:Region found in RelA / SpoT proteins